MFIEHPLLPFAFYVVAMEHERQQQLERISPWVHCMRMCMRARDWTQFLHPLSYIDHSDILLSVNFRVYNQHYRPGTAPRSPNI